ncbi:MAG: hypothetical protein VYE81_05125 [Planctomycetota bacterium]|nr:hypothetical protein [Planctomycetota bacterium]
MAAVKDVDKVFQSGTRVTFTMKGDAKPDEEALAKADKTNKLEFVSLVTETRKRAAAAYAVDCPKFT